MISRRKRMLQTFLNRVSRHPILSNEHVFHRFLDGEASWVGQTVDSGHHAHEINRLRYYTRLLYHWFRRIFSKPLLITQLKLIYHPPMLHCLPLLRRSH